MNKKTPKFYLKDILFNTEKVTKLAKEIALDYPKLNTRKFIDDIVKQFPNLELKQRMYHIRDILHKHLPQNFVEATHIILQALPEELDSSLGDGDYGDFIHAPYAEYIATYGMDKKHVRHSLHILEEISKRFSVEFAIRHFLNTYTDQTLQQCIVWSKNKNYHLRRLASEGTRPRLPWGIKIPLQYKRTEPILDNLFYDKTRYVTRSVANHLNDISKIDPDYVLQKLKQWDASKKQNQKEMDFITKHSLRTLRKRSI